MMEKREIRKFDIRDKVGYALGDCANNFTLTMVSSFLLFIHNNFFLFFLAGCKYR